MDRRTTLLLGALVLVGTVLLADQFGLLSLDEGVSEHQLAMDRVSKQISKAEDIMTVGAAATDQLAAYERRSLPYDTELARSEYLNWLTELVRYNKLTQSSADVGQPTLVAITANGEKVEAYQRYVFTLSAQGKLDQVIELLFDFYQGGHLHKITTLSLVPGSSGHFNVTIAGEVLGIPSCSRESKLTNLEGNRLAMDQLEDYSDIVRRNMFSREVGIVLRQVRLTSITFDRAGLPEAWFKIGAEQKTERLQRGGKLQVSVHHIEVVDIQPRSVLVEVDGTLVDLRIGKSVHEAMRAPVIAAG